MYCTSKHVDAILDRIAKDGFLDLVRICKLVKSSNPFPSDLYKHLLYNEQIAINLPILFLASVELHRFAQAQGIKTLLFVTRDCGHWVKIFRVMYPTQYNIEYLFSSRMMFETAAKTQNKHYKKYFKQSCHGDVRQSIYVDVHGTGKHMLDYCLPTFRTSPACFLLSIGAKSYKDLPPRSKELWTQGRLKGLSFGVSGSPIEMFNYQPYGSVMDFKSTGPVLAEAEYDINRLKPYRDCRIKFVSLLEKCNPQEITTSKTLGTIQWLCKQVSDRSQQPLLHKWMTHVKKHSRVIDPETGKYTQTEKKRKKK